MSRVFSDIHRVQFKRDGFLVLDERMADAAPRRSASTSLDAHTPRRCFGRCRIISTDCRRCTTIDSRVSTARLSRSTLGGTIYRIPGSETLARTRCG